MVETAPLDLDTVELKILQQMAEGTVMYKSFDTQKTLKTTAKLFDPLIGDQINPEQCGYGIRLFQLDVSSG